MRIVRAVQFFRQYGTSIYLFQILMFVNVYFTEMKELKYRLISICAVFELAQKTVGKTHFVHGEYPL